MDPAAPRTLDRVAGAVDVLEAGAGEAGHGRVLHAPGDLRDRFEIAVRGDGETGLDDIDLHLVEQLGDLDLFLEGHGGAGTLLAVAERRVKDQDAIGGLRSGWAHIGSGHGG